jgi:hypothetical protein
MLRGGTMYQETRPSSTSAKFLTELDRQFWLFFGLGLPNTYTHRPAAIFVQATSKSGDTRFNKSYKFDNALHDGSMGNLF